MSIQENGCIVCGGEIEYLTRSETMTCYLCGKRVKSASRCMNGHYVCDECHVKDTVTAIIPFLLDCHERDSQRIFDMAAALPGVHMHGPEHHTIVPCALLTAFYNCGGEIDLKEALNEAVNRGTRIPGGTCGFWGACGASVGAGIYISILTGAGPLSRGTWAMPQELVLNCLEGNSALGGPRCCKRTGRIAIEAAVNFTAERLGVIIPWTKPTCSQHGQNRQCLGERCPYYPK